MCIYIYYLRVALIFELSKVSSAPHILFQSIKNDMCKILDQLDICPIDPIQLID